MFKLFKNFTKKDKVMILFCFLFVVVQVWLDLKLPDYMSNITLLVETEGSTMKEILKEGGFMLLCALGSLTSSVFVGYLASHLSANFSYTIRKKIYDKVMDFGLEEMKKFETSSLITRTTNDVTQMEMIIAMGLQMIIKSPIMAVWAIGKIINKSMEWSMLTGACVIVLLVSVLTIMVIVIPRFEKVQKRIDKLNNVMRESITGIRVVRAFNAEKYQENKFQRVNKDLTDMQLFNQKCFALLSPIMNLVMYGLTLGIYFIGSILIENSILSGKITLFSNMVIFSSYGMQVIMSFLMLAMIFMMWPRASVSARRINEVLESSIKIKDGKGILGKEVGTLVFQNVSFKYPDASDYLLENISFEVEQGETVAFIGSTGSGKSSLVNLIPRFYDVTEGSILVDGVDVKEYHLHDLRNKISYVPQKAILFTGSVKENVTYGSSKVSKEIVEKSLEVAQASEFVSKMENKEEAHIARGGTNISGGQKQRLSIARAIYKHPEIYIFDDSFSALDYKTDSILRRELKKYTKEATTLIVAQRIGTILNADKIIVLDNGKCVGMGTHKELMKSCKVYQEIAYSQLSRKELENA